MNYVKSILAGLCGVIAFAVVTIAAIYVKLEFFTEPGAGVIMAGGRAIVAGALVIFLAGFAWTFRRLSRR